jgi:ketosteroid isomerase-like protein
MYESNFFTKKILFMETLVHYGQKVNQLFDAYNRRDVNAIINSLSRDCIWEVMGQPEIPFAGIYHGKDDIKDFFGKLEDTLDMSEFSVEHILENGNLVVATGHFNALARKTNKRFSTIWSMTFEFNDNEEIVHFRDCFDTLTCARALRDK